MNDSPTQFHDLHLPNGAVLRVQPITPSVFRIRLRMDSNFEEPGLVRYGIVRSDWPEVAVAVDEREDVLALKTEEATLTLSRRDGRATLVDAAGKVVLREAEPPQCGAKTGFSVELELAHGERLYGQGDETRDRIQKRGHRGRMVLMNVTSYVPIPFLMSTGGWAIFMNSTWFHYFDAGATKADRLRFWADRGELDYYLIAGDSLPTLLDRYTQITGRPHLLPRWAYGLTFVCDERGVRARDILYEAHYFRKEGLPCDVIGLEPDWMDKHYDFSVDKQWSTERFHVPAWKPHGEPGGFAAGLRNMGFKLSLWLCCDYDVSEYEELQLGAKTADSEAVEQVDTEDDIIKDPHFHPRYFDTITKPGEPWFEHLKKFVDDGARAFKMDGSNQVCFHPDRKWKNGMDDEEMHNLYPVLLAKQMCLGYQEHTGERAMIYTAGGYAGTQQYAATWAGDTGGDQKPLVSILNHGLSGHSNTSCDMQVWTREGIHFGFLQPWSQILSWHQYNQPWFLGDELYPVFRFYAKLRYRLLPYLYSMAHVAARTGLPMMRAMPLVAPDDPKSDELTLQYLLGDAFLTAAFSDTIYLPEGTWIDYWTGAAHRGPKELPCQFPEDRGGSLFVRAGAIIPTGPDMDYVGQVPLDTLGLDVYPHGESQFTLYEDDGVTDAYLDGRMATTEIKCDASGKETVLTTTPRVGEYDGMPQERAFDLQIHCDSSPKEVHVDGQTLAGEPSWSYDEEQRIVTLPVREDVALKEAAVVRIVHSNGA